MKSEKVHMKPRNSNLNEDLGRVYIYIVVVIS